MSTVFMRVTTSARGAPIAASPSRSRVAPAPQVRSGLIRYPTPPGGRSPYADRCRARAVRHLDPRDVRLADHGSAGCRFGLRGAALREPPGVANEPEGAE